MTSIGSSLETHEQDALCEKHGAYTERSMYLAGRWLALPCPRCADETKRRDAEDAKRKQAEDRRSRIKALIGRAGIPRRFEGRTFENFRAESDGQKRALQVSSAYTERFEDRLRYGGGLVFCGKPGTGKTHLACAIANHVIQMGRSAVFMSVIRAIRSVKDTYRRDSDLTEQQAINALIAPDLLILDEVGVQFGSDTEKMILFEVMNGRYEDVRPTIVLSNLVREELGAYLGERVLDRLQEGGGATVAFDWESYRPNVHRDAGLLAPDVLPVNWSAT